MSPSRAVIAALALLAAPSVAWGHDFWIEPSSHRPKVEAPLRLSLRVGQAWKGDAVPRNEGKIERFTIVGPGGERAVPGLDGGDPAGLVRLDLPGTYVVGYRSKRTTVELGAAKFESYLKEEGLEAIVAARVEHGWSLRSGREVFSRCAKTLVTAGGGPADGYDRVLGMTFEIVPEKDPRSLAASEALPLRLLYEGKPIEGVLVVALAKDDPSTKISARTDRDGRCALPLAKSGTWLVKAVHMVSAPKGVDADWESFWASLTFEVVGRGP